MAGSGESKPGDTSFLHRANGVVSGVGVGAVLGALAVGPLGDGMGGDGLIYPLIGMAAGAVGGSVGGGILAGKFPDKERN